ncbi:MAG: TetR family transcriptional regulator C-terminal domain-containing protein [Actinomycetota bacterium]
MVATGHNVMVEAAIAAIHDVGASGVTVAAVADRAGVDRDDAAVEFPTEHALLVATLATLVDEWTRATEPEEGTDPAEALRATISAMFSPVMFTDTRVTAWLSLSALASTDPELRALRERAQRSWVDQMARSLSAARIDRPNDRAIALLAMADGLWLRYSLEPTALTRLVAEDIALDIVDQLLV